MSEYECPKCKRVYTGAERTKSQFCPDCGMHLRPKYTRQTQVRTRRQDAIEIEPVEYTRGQINVFTLFEEFMRLKRFSMGEGLVGADVPSWIFDRKRAYMEFQTKLGVDVICDTQALHDNFKAFLYFKNNLSWTTLYRSGTKALQHLTKLKHFLVLLQDESTPVNVRVDQGIGKNHVEGIGIAILTGLLHTFFPDKYGVWNSRTIDTLHIIKRKPTLTSNFGRNYLRINKELLQLAKELNTDLVTIDGFMWFISKRIKIIA